MPLAHKILDVNANQEQKMHAFPWISHTPLLMEKKGALVQQQVPVGACC